MRFRLGALIGFGAGYYLGSAAGPERHEQLNQMIRKVKRSETFEEATEKAKAVVDLSVERAKDFKNKDDDGLAGSGFETRAEAAQFSVPQPGATS